MKNKLFVFYILFYILLFYSFTLTNNNEDCIIEWNKNRKLTWNDFKGEIPKIKNGAAISGTGVFTNFSYSNRKINIKIIAVFDCNKSWTNTDNNEALIHEQGHFDIAEIYARKLRMELSIIGRTKKEGHIMQINKYINDKEQQRKDYNKLYDKETKHSINKEKQKEWNERIAKELEELEEYKEQIIEIKLK